MLFLRASYFYLALSYIAYLPFHSIPYLTPALVYGTNLHLRFMPYQAIPTHAIPSRWISARHPRVPRASWQATSTTSSSSSLPPQTPTRALWLHYDGSQLDLSRAFTRTKEAREFRQVAMARLLARACNEEEHQYPSRGQPMTEEPQGAKTGPPAEDPSAQPSPDPEPIPGFATDPPTEGPSAQSSPYPEPLDGPAASGRVVPALLHICVSRSPSACTPMDAEMGMAFVVFLRAWVCSWLVPALDLFKSSAVMSRPGLRLRLRCESALPQTTGISRSAVPTTLSLSPDPLLRGGTVGTPSPSNGYTPHPRSPWTGLKNDDPAATASSPVFSRAELRLLQAQACR